jgi:protein arginine kinase activator
MSLAEFRSKGRLGCPRDYEVFRAHLEPLLLRVHSAKEHRGRLPGNTEAVRSRTQQLTTLKAKLEAAIREEAYESAARLRDEIQELEAPVVQSQAVPPSAVPGKSPPRPA